MKTSPLFRYLFYLTLISIITSETKANEIKTASTIKAVTVYNDQALITRAATVNMPAGVHTIIFTGLPDIMIDQSLKVSGVSEYEAKISDIKIERLFLDTLPAAHLTDLYQRLYNLRVEKNALDRTNLLYKSQADAVDMLRDNYSRSLANPNPGQKPSLDEWDKLLQYVEKKKIDYWGKMESLRIEIESKVNKIKALEDEIKNVGGLSRKSEKQINVTIHTDKGDSLNFEISYLIPDASWSPTYEARVTSAEKSLQLVYSGYVRQSSGEDWADVDMTLSTAQPAMSQTVPSLVRWTVDSRPVANARPAHPRRPARPLPPPTPTLTGNTLSGRVLDTESDQALVGANVVIEGTSLGGSTDLNGDYVIYNIPEGTYKVRASYIGYQGQGQADVRISKSNGANQFFYLQASIVSGQEVVVTAQAQGQMQAINQQLASTQIVNVVSSEASIAATQLTSSSFSIPSKQSIPSDNQNHKVGIAIEDFPIDFSYEVVPKVMQAAFLKGKGKNIEDYPLLAGNANVFLDNSFVASVPIKTIMPADSFSMNLGIDDGIRVERKLVSRFTESVGTFSTKTRTKYEFENIIENHKKYPVEVTLTDQVPISADEKIVVELQEPKSDVLIPDADGILRWKLNLGPGESKVIKLKFTVEYSPSVFPYGLE
jgi:hypothetical protein